MCSNSIGSEMQARVFFNQMTASVDFKGRVGEGGRTGCAVFKCVSRMSVDVAECQ